MRGKRVIVFDDVLAQAGTLEDTVDGLYQNYAPARVDSVNVLSKGRIQELHRPKDEVRGIMHPRKGVERAQDCLNRRNEDGSERVGELVVALDVVGINQNGDEFEIFYDKEELLNAA